MFHLIKLAAYALLGYAIYEFVMGMSAEIESKASESRGGRQSGQSRGGNAAQPRGRATTQDADGGSQSHAVGRGVVQQ